MPVIGRSVFLCCAGLSAALLGAKVFAQQSYIVRSDVQDCVNVRSDSNTDAAILACLPDNSSISVLDSRPYWREIEFGQTSPGWIAKRYIIPSPAPPIEPVPYPLPSDMWLTVHFIDVGQGDAN